MHITGISRLSTSIRCKFELHSLLHCGTTTAQSIFLHTLGLTHSCCKVMTLQHYRHIGAVGSRLNYLRTEYGTPTGSSSCSRTDTKTDLESHDRINVVMLTYHTWHGVPRRSISMLVLAVFHIICSNWSYNPIFIQSGTLAYSSQKIKQADMKY